MYRSSLLRTIIINNTLQFISAKIPFVAYKSNAYWLQISAAHIHSCDERRAFLNTSWTTVGATSAGKARAEYPFFRVAEKLDGAAPAKSVARNGANSPLHVYIKQSIGEWSIHRCFVQFRGGFVPAIVCDYSKKSFKRFERDGWRNLRNAFASI